MESGIITKTASQLLPAYTKDVHVVTEADLLNVRPSDAVVEKYRVQPAAEAENVSFAVDRKNVNIWR